MSRRCHTRARLSGSTWNTPGGVIISSGLSGLQWLGREEFAKRLGHPVDELSDIGHLLAVGDDADVDVVAVAEDRETQADAVADCRDRVGGIARDCASTAVSSSHARAHGYFLGFRFWRCVSHDGPAVIRPISPDASSLSFPATGSKPGMGFDIPPDVHEADGVGCRWRVKATRRAVVGAAVHPRAKNAGGFHEMGPGATGFTPRHPVIIVVAPVSPVDGLIPRSHSQEPHASPSGSMCVFARLIATKSLEPARP